MKLLIKVMEFYCIADEVCNKYELESNKKHLRVLQHKTLHQNGI